MLTPKAVGHLRRLFYALAISQFAFYATLEDAFHDASVPPYLGSRLWLVLGLVLAAEVGLLGLHSRLEAARRRARAHDLMEGLI